MSLHCFGRGYTSKGCESSSPKFWGVFIIKSGVGGGGRWGALIDLEYFLGGDLGKKGWGQYFRGFDTL